MRMRANSSVYWPGMTSAIKNYRLTCQDCDKHAPSLPAEPMISSPSPEWPFQQICMDYFEMDNSHSYLITVDRYSGWPSVFHFKPGQATAQKLLSTLRNLFATFGIPEEASSDGGPQFKAEQFTDFLNNWKIHHRKSSVGYAQSNGRAEVGVKTMKRILRNNLSADGSLNNDKVLAAILEYRNTPLPDIELSPAQILFHRQLRDAIPTHRSQYHLHKDWVIAAEEREQLYAKRNKAMVDNYNQHTRPLRELSIGTEVLIQEKNNKWNKQGIVVECLPYRQYRIKVNGSGRLTLQNRRFLRPCTNQQQQAREVDAPSRSNPVMTPTVINLDTVVPSGSDISPPALATQERHADKAPLRMSRELRNLRTYNKPGLSEPAEQPIEDIPVNQPRTLRERR